MSGKRKTLIDRAHTAMERAMDAYLRGKRRNMAYPGAWMDGYRASQRSARAAGKKGRGK